MSFDFFKTRVCYVYSLESPPRGDFNENIQHTIINIKRKPPEISQIEKNCLQLWYRFC